MKRRSWHTVWVCLGLLIAVGRGAFAQTDSARTSNSRKAHHRYWISGGFSQVITQYHPPGLPAVYTEEPVPDERTRIRLSGGMVSAHFQPRHKRGVFTARYVVNAELIYHPTPGLKYTEVGGLYGIRLHNFLLSTGLSKVWGVDRGRFLFRPDPHALSFGNTYEKVTYAKLGIPIEARFILPSQWVSLGITAFGNINDGHSYGGLNLSICLGRMN